MEKTKIDEKPKMVEWYNPWQLLDTGKRTALSTIVGEYADPRLGNSTAKPGNYFDYSTQITPSKYDFKPFEIKKGEKIETIEREEIWIDYVADVGEGWNSTYSVAYELVKPSLKINGEDLARGEILIFGGDGVYPTAKPEEYEKRLVSPYRMAFRSALSSFSTGSNEEKTGDQKPIDLKKQPHVFALPGNHDWYDSLAAFKKVFCSHLFNGRRFAFDKETETGGWRTRQKRSYFGLKLPHNWWLLSIDLQLSHNIDINQLQYFQSLINQMEKGDKVILCVPEPYWVKAIKYHAVTEKFAEKEESIKELEEYFDERGIEVKLYLAGDLHHYRRFVSGEETDEIHRITAGGGGAFMHPTHDFKFPRRENFSKIPAEDLKKMSFFKTSYPEYDDSKKLDKKNLLFFWNNKSFGIFTAIIYAVLAWLMHGRIFYDFPLNRFWIALTNLIEAPSELWTVFRSWKGFWITLNNLIEAPLAVLVIVLMFFGVVFFTDTNSKLQKWLGGSIHAIAHLLAAIFLSYLGYLLAYAWIGNFDSDKPSFQENLKWFICTVGVAAAGGYFLGAIIMGVYLYVSLHWFNRHDNEAFSALKIEDYKNFLRLHINAEGKLTIYPIKIEKVEREWDPVKVDKKIISYNPKNEIKPELIENPIVL